MTTPCRAECIPSRPCPQSDRCARHDPAQCDPLEQPIDAWLLRHSGGNWCPMFIDTRAALLEVA